MRIDSNSYQQTVYTNAYVGSKSNNKENRGTSIPSIDSVEKIKDNSTGIWSELKDKYDIRNATFDELSNISSQLYKAGEISLLDHAIITFNPSKSKLAVKPNINATQGTQDGRRDWIVEFQSRAYRELKNNNLQGYIQNKRISGILSRLD